jgi:hypothetical protein
MIRGSGSGLGKRRMGWLGRGREKKGGPSERKKQVGLEEKKWLKKVLLFPKPFSFLVQILISILLRI